MNALERVKLLCKERKIPISRLERDLGFANGYISQLKKDLPSDRLSKISEYLEISVDYLMTGKEKKGGETYYLNEETREMAQEIFENKELRLLFSAARDADAEDLKATHDILLALKRKERGTY